jgi:hypothetical protein
MKCKKCGYELKEEWNICPRCAEPVATDREIEGAENPEQVGTVRIEERPQPANGAANGRFYPLYLIVFFSSIACGILFSPIRIIGFLVALITIVTAYIIYPKNIAIKVLFWLFLIGTILTIIYLVVAIAVCYEAMRTCPG